MGYSQQQIVSHYGSNLDLARELYGHWGNLLAGTEAHVARIEGELKRARLDLAEAYLLELSPPALQRVEQLTGFRGFTRRDPLKAMAHEAVVLGKTIARIEADERWIRRVYLVGPQGELTRELDEAKGMLEPWELECAKFEQLDGFLELVEIGYDTDAFDEWWYQPKYWKHWAAGDRICATLGLDDFGDDVLPAYEKVRQPREQWRAQVRVVEAKIDEVHELVRRRDQAEARIPRLPAIYLASCQAQLAEFFERADLGLLEEWLAGAGGDRGVTQVLRRAAGLAAKVRFLREMIEGIQAQMEALDARASKFNRKMIKYQRQKYWSSTFGDRDLDLKFQGKADKYRSAPSKLGAQVERIIDFDEYGSFDLQNDPELWYVHMTRKSPSRFTPRLRTWYERHPGAAPVLEDDDGDLEAAVYVAASQLDRTDRGYLS